MLTLFALEWRDLVAFWTGDVFSLSSWNPSSLSNVSGIDTSDLHVETQAVLMEALLLRQNFRPWPPV